MTEVLGGAGETPGAVLVRLARPDEFAAVAALTVAVYIGESYSPPEREAQLRDVAGRAAATELLVAVDAATECVLGAVSVVLDSGRYLEAATAGEAEVRLLAVDPAARGRGAGEALMRDCLVRARAHGFTRMALSTQPTMRAAHRLYERLGFTRALERDYTSATGRQMLVYTLAL
jgi:ribosomal protein S18 acetylase RimI-like enzyme